MEENNEAKESHHHRRRKHHHAPKKENCSSNHKKLKEFCDETSLHGLKYITEDNVSWTQRVLWAFFFLISFLAFFYLFSPIMNKYLTTATFTTVETTNYDISNIPFPGVTVCSNFRVTTSGFTKQTKTPPWSEYSEKALHQLVSNLVSLANFPRLMYFESETDNLTKTHSERIPEFMSQITPKCDTMFLYCKWQGDPVSCKKYVKTRKTDLGYCCSFNTKDLSAGFAKDEVDEDEEETSTPAAQSVTGSTNSTDAGSVGTNSSSGPSSDETTPDTPTDGEEEEEKTWPDKWPYQKIYDYYRAWGTGYYYGIIVGYENDPDNYCYTFNETHPMKNRTSNATAEEMILENDSGEEEEEEEEEMDILHTNIAGQDFGFSFLLNPNFHDEFRDMWDQQTANNLYVGYKVLIHSPDEFPDVSKAGITVETGTETNIAISAQVTQPSDTVVGMAPSRRKCLLKEDLVVESMGVETKVFAEYRKRNCLLECQAREMLRRCGCLMYYYPDFPDNFLKENLEFFEPKSLHNLSFDTFGEHGANLSKEEYIGTAKRCAFQQLLCLADYKNFFNSFRTSEFMKPHPGLVDGLVCSCPDNCEDTIYTQETTSAAIVDMNKRLTGDALWYRPESLLQKELDALYSVHQDNCANMTFTSKITRFSMVHVYFKEMGATKFVRDELYSWQDIVANFGGTVGLCIGFSLLSAAEMFYFLFLRSFMKESSD